MSYLLQLRKSRKRKQNSVQFNATPERNNILKKQTKKSSKQSNKQVEQQNTLYRIEQKQKEMVKFQIPCVTYATTTSSNRVTQKQPNCNFRALARARTSPFSTTSLHY